MKILLATTNKNKILEIKKAVGDSCELVLLSDLPEIEDCDEPFETFMENATHKAKYYAEKTGMPALSDDAGLCVDALGGAPGVYSKRFIEESGGLAQAFDRLETMLDGKDRSAYFSCSVALYIPESDLLLQGEGIVRGKLRFPAFDAGGFIYDRILVPDGYDKTFAELGFEVKSEISYRTAAVKKVMNELKALLSCKSVS